MIRVQPEACEALWPRADLGHVHSHDVELHRGLENGDHAEHDAEAGREREVDGVALPIREGQAGDGIPVEVDEAIKNKPNLVDELDRRF